MELDRRLGKRAGFTRNEQSVTLAPVDAIVLVVMTIDDKEDAIAFANDAEYGLVASIWTETGARQQRIARRLNCGQVFVYCQVDQVNSCEQPHARRS